MANSVKKIRTPNVSKRATAASSRGQGSLWKSILFSFIGGVAVATMLLAILAWLFAHTALPFSLVRPLACGAAAGGAAVSGWLLAKKVGRQFLLCGLGFGLFYAVCQCLAAAVCNGGIVWQVFHFMLPAALLLGGLFGGALAALRAVR